MSHSLLFFSLVTAVAAEPSLELLDKDLTKFEVFMGVPHTSVTGLKEGTFQSDDVTSGEPMGLNADVKNVFSVVEEDGKLVLKVTGEIYGGLTTLESFGDYHFSTLFRWGDKKWEPRLNDKRDSGILYHCQGEHGNFWKVWKSSLEFQVQETDLGEFIPLSGPKATVRVSPQGDKYRYDPESKESKVITDYTFTAIEEDKPHGEWNHLELYTFGQTAVHVVNGVVVMVLEKTENSDGTPLTEGQIQIQSEAAECFYKEMKLTPITRLPEAVLSQIPFELQQAQ